MMRDGAATHGRFSDGLAIGLTIAFVAAIVGLAEVRAQRDNVAKARAKCADVWATDATAPRQPRRGSEGGRTLRGAARNVR